MNWIVPLDIGIVMGLIFAWAVLALSLGFRLLSFPDLTIEGSLPLGAAVFAVLHKSGAPMIISTFCAMFAGALAGALTGFLHVKFSLNKFLSGILVVAIAYSISLRIMGASNIGLLQLSSVFDYVSSWNTVFGKIHLGTIFLLFGFLASGSILILYILSTRYGIQLRVAGSNPAYARSLGINVSVNILIGLAATNSLAALSGVLLSMHQGFVDISMGQGTLILALAAMTVGERLLPEKRLPFYIFVFFAGILGSVIYQMLLAYAVYIGLAPTDLKLATAIMVLAVVALRISHNGELFAEGS